MEQGKIQSTTILTRITTVYIVGMFSIFLLYPGVHGYENITAQKAGLYFLLTGLYIIAIILFRLELSLIGNRAWTKPRTLWRDMGLAHKLILIYWIFSVLSTLFSNYKEIAFWGNIRFDGLVTITLYCFSFLFVSFYAKPGRWMLWLFAGAVSANCILALIQLAGYNPLGLYPEGMDYYDAFILYSGQFLGTIGNVDLLSAFFCIAIPVFWISIFKLKGRLRFLLLIPLALCLAVLFISFVSGGVLGITVGALLSIPVIASRKQHRVILACLVGFIIIAGLAVVYFSGDRFGGFVYEANQIMHGNWNDSFGSGRLYIWRKSLDLMDGHWLLGGGPDTMGLRTDAVFERYDEALGILIQSHVDTAHNEYLNVLVNQGLFALLAYLAALIAAAVHWVRTAPVHAVSAICGGAVLCYCIQALFGISSLVSAPYFWLSFALLLCPIYSKNENSNTGGKRHENSNQKTAKP